MDLRGTNWLFLNEIKDNVDKIKLENQILATYGTIYGSKKYEYNK